MIILETERLILRNWRPSDRDLFREINADPKVMEFFPFRRSYEESDAVLEKLNGMITDTGIGFYAMALKETGEPMGFCGLSPTNLPEIFPDGMVEIGWRLATRYWSNGYVTEASLALLDDALVKRGMKAVVSFAVAENRRSTAVMERIGMQRQPGLDFTHPRVPDTHPHLKHHVVYAAAAELWRPRQAI
ncbi:GNAT family N-acetyltransferase [Rhizobium panacihumi]|uniref:GNAT family N-acetyltransferase n=1 Tax=Rhizobium panacihumi TaxID=2008450 RepID=UPI003D7BB870